LAGVALTVYFRLTRAFLACAEFAKVLLLKIQLSIIDEPAIILIFISFVNGMM
jgi:hypothetical protein